MSIEKHWKEFAVNNAEIEKSKVREIIYNSWQRCRDLKVDPFSTDIVRISEENLTERKKRKKDMLTAAMPHLHKLYKSIKDSSTSITITDEEGVILDSFYSEELRKMKYFPVIGSIHLEKIIGTNGIGTSLATGQPVQIIGAEHWLKSNHEWFCNTTPIYFNKQIIGTLNISCLVDKGHAHSLGLVVTAAYAIEREMIMNVMLKERKNLVTVQKTIIDLLDTGIIVINSEGKIIQNNDKAQQILDKKGDWTGCRLDEIIDCTYDFNRTFSERKELENLEIPVKINRKHSYIGFSSAFIENSGATEAMILRIQESASIRRFANMAGGSNAIYTFNDIIGSSSTLQKTLKMANLAAKNNTNVLVSGESGTGKELVAQAIHNASSRKNKPFVAINCGALSRELIQSELFGYEGGSFTGAKKNGNPGKFELADEGTLFLDEIGEMPLDAQTNLLRILQTGNVLRIGAQHPNRVDVRVIAATNKNLEYEISMKNFRHDLYYRLNVLQISIPPLRERKTDIISLAEHFLKKFTQGNQSISTGFSPEAIEMIKNYNWPGNIRELENTIERAVVISENEQITPAHLPDSITNYKNNPDDSAAVSHSLNLNIAQVEVEYIKDLLLQHRGNLRAVSASMGVARSTLYNKMKKYGLNVENYR